MAYVKQIRDPDVQIWTDGACSGNPGPGGWAFLAEFAQYEGDLVASGHVPSTTNNQMELQAVIEALRILMPVPRMKVVIHSDSQYIINAFEKGWIDNWQRYQWIKSDGKPVANKEQWQEILNLTESQIITFNWVRGHHTSQENNTVDRLAVEAARRGDRLSFMRSTLKALPGGSEPFL